MKNMKNLKIIIIAVVAVAVLIAGILVANRAGVFEEETDAEKCAEKLKGFIKDVFVAKPVKQGLEIIE